MRLKPTRGTVPMVYRAAPDLAQLVRVAAELAGVTVSEFTRQAVAEAAARIVKARTSGGS